MASITRQEKGRKKVQFVAPDGKRKTIRLGKVSMRLAESVKFRVEQLLAANMTGHAIDTDTARWVADLDLTLAKKLSSVGLIPKPEEKDEVLLEPFLKKYLEGRGDLKPATKIVKGQVIRDLSNYFGKSRELRTITPGNADDFKQWLIGRELAPTTIHKRLQEARSFFRAMLRRKLIDENPFEGVSAKATGIKDRQRFVTREEIERVLDACPDHHWRTIVVLSRYGGLRCPSEVLSLRWQDINWDTGRIVVTSPKTEHHAGKESRVIPLFPELRSALDESFDLAPEGTEFVVDERFRRAAMGPAGWKNVNLRTTFLKIVKRAGLSPWPRLFHNLRASRETELVESFPVQVVTSWLGNTPSVALRHYLITTEEHFQSALDGTTKAAHNPAQQVHVLGRNESQAEVTAHEKTPELQGFASHCESVQELEVAGTGFEPATSRL